MRCLLKVFKSVLKTHLFKIKCSSYDKLVIYFAICLIHCGIIFMDYNNNNNNNDKTSIVPISLKRIKLSGTTCSGVGQIHSLGTMQSS